MRLSALVVMLVIRSALLCQDYPLQAVPFSAVTVEDSFWSPRLEVNRTVSIPHAFRECEETGRLKNFTVAASVKSGEAGQGVFCSRYPFDDSDVFKIIEGASYLLVTHPDTALETYLGSVITLIAEAQEDDGYLYTMRTMRAENSWAPERWVNARRKASHELYNVGHLYEAAVAHYRATGKTTLLDIALRNADLLVRTFGPDRMSTVPGHQETELGLVQLYRLTGRSEYLSLAEFFLEERGRGNEAGDTYNQDHLPVAEQTDAVGHAVRAGYQYAAMADVGILAGRSAYLSALEGLWDDVLRGKLYITGGVGSAGSIEGFSDAYDLPNISAYCETCAAIALVLWSQRMFLLTGDGKYVDVIERVLYNAFLAGVSIEGDRFFYVNPLESQAGADRSSWFACACCPSNVVRFLPRTPSYAYAHRKWHLYVNLFLAGTAQLPMDDGPVTITQHHRYPWDGDLTIGVDPGTAREFTLHLRIPGWARNRPVPGDLYRDLTTSSDSVTIRVNGVSVSPPLEAGYAVLRRLWRPGDVVELELPLSVRRVVAREALQDDRGKTALERGPIVYCLEGADRRDGKVWHLVLADSAQLLSEFRGDLLGGVQIIRGTATPVSRSSEGGLSLGEAETFLAIPYYAWAHRGRSQMTVWIARQTWAAKPLPAPTIASMAKVSSSAGTGLEAVTDQLLPNEQGDRSLPVFVLYPRRGTQEWLQLDFHHPEVISRITLYWYADAHPHGCRLPQQWRLSYRAAGEWRTLRAALGPPGESVSTVQFEPARAEGARLEIDLQASFSGGVYEWIVE